MVSKGEEKIAEILRQAHIKFEQEKSFDDLKGGRYRFDFYVPNFNGRPLIIEVDGQQHFQRCERFQKTQTAFKKNQEHDRQKNSYCLANDLPLYRIPCWELPNLRTVNDIIQPKFCVKSKWHNDLLVSKIGQSI